MIKKISLAVLMVFLVSNLSYAEEAPLLAKDPELEERVKAISAELRCLVCQNQTISDSNAGLAVDLKNQVRDMLRRGMSERQIKDFMVERYGDFVLYDPPVKGTTMVLWIGPLLMLILAFHNFPIQRIDILFLIWLITPILKPTRKLSRWS